MSQPLVSVVMPVYNAEKFLREAVDSILKQTYTNLELILVNDGSTDDSKEIILSYSDPRIRYFENERNLGIVETRNRATAKATGEYLAMLDSDDIALPDRLEQQVAFLEANRQFGVCGAIHQHIDENNKLQEKIVYPSSHRDIRTHMTITNCFCNSTVMLRTALARKEPYSAEYPLGEDYELFYRLSSQTQVTNLPVLGTLYRVHGNNISLTKIDSMFAMVRKLNHRILADLGLTYTEKEMELHMNFIFFYADYFREGNNFAQLEDWLLRFYGHIAVNKDYNERLLYRMLIERWIIMSIKAKKLNKLLFNRFVRRHRRLYLKIFFRKVKSTLTNGK